MGYTFLIVDDEGLERMALSQIIKREFQGDVTVHTLPNGMEMLRFLENQKADIAIVDIDMPGLNGIETIRQLRQRGNNMKVIINTAYSNFQYAVDAIKLEVDDYLVKPLKRDKLIETVRSCIRKLEEERQESNRQKDVMSALKPAISGTFLRAVEKDQITQEDWDAYMDAIGIRPERSVIALFSVDGWPSLGSSYQQNVVERIIGTLSMENACIATNQPGRGVIALVVQKPGQHSRVFFEQLQQDLSVICGRIADMTYCNTRVGVGSIVEGVLQLHTSYQQAKEALAYEQDKPVSFFDFIPQAERQAAGSDSAVPQSKPVRMACVFVRSNYREEISLDSVAEKVGVTASYLSRLFKKEMGINFQDFLTDVRMDKAVELLRDESLSIRMLSQMVGYNNHTYFCKIFKKKTGKTVGEYRESLGMKNQEQEELL